MRYSLKRDDENEMIADLLVGLTTVHKTWVSGYVSCTCGTSRGKSGTTSGVHRIYCELELNLRIKPRRWLKREKPEEVAAPEPRT